MTEELSREKMDNVGHTIRMMAELLNTLRQTKLILAVDSLEKLSDEELSEFQEAIRLIRRFLNNL